jgi:hypothetical protein
VGYPTMLKKIMEIKMDKTKTKNKKRKTMTLSYEAKLDSKKRVTLRNAIIKNFRVIEYDNGEIILKPQILIDLEDITEVNLKRIETAVHNMKKGIVSEPIDLKNFNFEDE